MRRKYLQKLVDNNKALLRLGGPRGEFLYVDGTNGADGNHGKNWDYPFATIQAAVTASSAGGTVVIAPKFITDATGDPASFAGTNSNYAETIIIPLAKRNLSLVGISTGRTQYGLPEIKMGSASTALITVRAPGCYIANLGINGASATGGGILLDDDYLTKSAFATTIENCHFKNCKGSSATNAATGGAIQWTSQGNAWQVLVRGCRFYKNVGDIVMKGTLNTVPQDVVIEDCVFSGPGSAVDCNIYVAADGINGIVVRDCEFQQKPAVGGGPNAKYIVMAVGTVGTISGCTFGCQTSHTGGTKITFKSGGTGGDFPATVHIMDSFGQTIHATESGEISVV